MSANPSSPPSFAGKGGVKLTRPRPAGRLGRAALFALALGAVGALVATPVASAITPAEYREVVAGALAQAERAVDADEGQRAGALAALARALDAVGPVELSDGR